jgi:hypothetical protein
MRIVRSVFCFVAFSSAVSCKPSGSSLENGEVSSANEASVVTATSRGFEVVAKKSACKEALVESSLSTDFCFNEKPSVVIRMATGGIGLLCLAQGTSPVPEVAAVVVDEQGKYVGEAFWRTNMAIQASWARVGNYRVYLGFPKNSSGGAVKIRFGLAKQFSLAANCEFLTD